MKKFFKWTAVILAAGFAGAMIASPELRETVLDAGKGAWGKVTGMTGGEPEVEPDPQPEPEPQPEPQQKKGGWKPYYNNKKSNNK
jgi:hypothetical protein